MTLKTKATHDLQRETQYAQQSDKWLKTEAWRIVRIVSFNLERAVKFTLPVLTGRLRASWGHSSPADLDLTNPKAFLSPGDSVWKESARGLAIEQGSNVHYLQYVNKDGRGPQFRGETIGELHEKHQDELERLTDDIISELARRM